MTLLSMTTTMASSGSIPSSAPFQPHWDLFPSFYVAQRAPLSFFQQIDGDLTKSAWEKVPWSAAFGDIQGDDDKANVHDSSEHSPPIALTQFKALWDDDHLYIGALLHPSDSFNTPAHFDQRNSPIYQKDSDFEVFVDWFGTNHNYKELEVNALNTVWNLMLNKPYLNGGVEHSGRVTTDTADPLYYEVHRQKTAVRVLEGDLNDNVTGAGALWSVEIAMAFSDLNVTTTASNTKEEGSTGTSTSSTSTSSIIQLTTAKLNSSPSSGSHVRINFSRVELQGDINWTWQPQRVYSASQHKYQGQVNMHLPESWGYLVFGNDDDDDDDDDSIQRTTPTAMLQPADIDRTWPAQVAAMHVYYAQDAYREAFGRFTFNLDDLVPYMQTVYTDPFTVHISHTWVKAGYRVTVADKMEGILVTVEQDRKLCVTVAKASDDDNDANAKPVSK
jgi:hypothetical protein